jgi:hypothetical protein
MSTPECPAPTVIVALLDGTLTDPSRANVLRHVEGCPACRAALNRATDQTQRAPPPARPDQLAPTQMDDEGDRTAPPGRSGEPSRTDARADEAPAPAGRAAPTSFLDPPGQDGSLGRLGPYEILQVLGEGSVGVVLEGYEPRLRRHVAIKVLAPQLTHSASARRRFAREGRATAALNHENIVTVHAVEDQGPRPYLVMEYVPGLSLQQRLNRTGPLPLVEAVRVGAKVAAGLAAAHAAGLVHRDIKPGNVLLETGPGRPSGEYRVKLTDFGLVQHEDGAVSQTDVLAGTPLYMSPEQARGERVDARSDLFSLGSVLYAMCAGRPPFSGRNPLAVLRQISETDPPLLRRLNPAVPAWLADLIAALHARDPAVRPAAADVARALEQGLADPALARRPRRRLGLLVALAVGLALAGLVLAEGAGLTSLRAGVGPWLRGEAHLTVYNADPESMVRLAGREEELHGTGAAEWTLPAGDYLLLRRRPGEPRQEKPIHLARGSRRMIQVESPQAPVADRPFVVLSRQGSVPRACANLSEAVGMSRPGDTIEVRGNGPFVMAPVTIARPLVICAGAGFHPVLRHDGRDFAHPLISTHRALALEGLQLEGAGFGSWKEGRFVVISARGPLAVAGCRLQITHDGACIAYNGPRLEVRRSLLLRGESGHGAISWSDEPGSTVQVDGCVVAGGHIAVAANLAPGPLRSLRLGHSTLLTGNAFCLLRDLNEDVKKPPAAPRLRIEVADCVLASRTSVFQVEQPARPGKTPLPFAASAALLPKLVALHDRGNFYPARTNLLGFTCGWQSLAGGRPWNTPREWSDYWGHRPVPDSLHEAIGFQGGEIYDRLVKDVAAVTAADFRLPATSPGKGTVRDGSDFGADVDLLGPGEPLARWRRTGEYQRWRRLVDRLMSARGEAK